MDDLWKRYRIDNSKRDKHTALIDCELLSKVYINLIDQKEPTLNFNNNDDKKLNVNKDDVSYYKKIIVPSREELKNHNEFLNKNIKKNFF